MKRKMKGEKREATSLDGNVTILFKLEATPSSPNV
jgi:hypothetical protein